jgi:hypothetical protein
MFKIKYGRFPKNKAAKVRLFNVKNGVARYYFLEKAFLGSWGNKMPLYLCGLLGGCWAVRLLGC